MKKLVLAALFTVASAGVYAQAAKSDAPAATPATPATAATPAEPGKGEGKALGHQKRGGKKKGHDKDRAKGHAEGHDDDHGKAHDEMHDNMHGADAPDAAAEGKKPAGKKAK